MPGSKILALALCTGLSAGGAVAGPPGALCDAAARKAAHDSGVPVDILLAITRAETGRKIDGQLGPWPWTINDNGQGHWFATEGEALQAVVARIAAGDDNFDIGCFQINTRWHGDGFGSINAMFDPLTNARYAADFLTRLMRQTGSWDKAIAAYHSRIPTLGVPYRDRVNALRTAPATEEPVQMATAQSSPNLFPLLQAGAPGAPGSIVPRQSGLAPLLGGRG